MDIPELLTVVSGLVLSEEARALRIRFLSSDTQELNDVLLMQGVDLHERMNDGIQGHVTCVSTRADIPLDVLRGVPVEVQMTTDDGGMRLVRALIDTAQRGASARSLTVYQLRIVDPLRFLIGRQSDRYLTLSASVVEMSNELFDVLLKQDCPLLGSLLRVRWQLRRDSAYPKRAMWLQLSECTATYLMREWRRAGISWVFRPLEDREGSIELLLFDAPDRLSESPEGGVEFNQSDVPLQRGTVLAWSEACKLTVGEHETTSWDFRAARLDQAQSRTRLPMDNSWGANLLASLRHTSLLRPHDADSWSDMQRLVDVRIDRAQFESRWFTGISSQCELRVGAYMQLRGLPGHLPMPQAGPVGYLMGNLKGDQYTIVDLHHVGHSNLQTISDLTARLLEDSAHLDGWAALPRLERMHGDGEHAYLNAFTAVLHGTPLMPHWDPAIHQPHARPVVAIVAGQPGMTVDVDNEGRVQVTIPGERTGRRTPRLPFNGLHAGHRQGSWFPLRVNMQVKLEFDGGDQNRPAVERVSHNAANPPPLFYEGGSSVAGNAAQAGIRLHEFGGSRYGELMFDNTPNQISVSLGSEHARSRLQLGELRGNRREGQAPAIGEGAYLHTLASLALRAAQVMLLSTFGRDDSSAWQLDMAEHKAAIEAANDLADALANYAAENQGKPMDTAARAQLAGYVAKATAGANVDPSGVDGGQPTLNLTALAGIAATALQSILLFAQTNLDATAAKNVQLTSGEHTILNARKSLGLFAAEGGLSAIAHQGELLLQSQKDGMRVQAAGDITIAAGGDVLIDGKNVLIRTESGTYVRLSDLLQLGSNGPLKADTGGHQWGGPSTNPAKLPRFGPPKPPDFCIKCLLNAAAGGSAVAFV